MASTFVLLIVLQLVTTALCITTADVTPSDSAGKVKDIDNEKLEGDLDTDETGWLYNPIQEKVRTLEYLKSKVLSPFITLQSPSTLYGGSYPVYSTSAGGGLTSSFSYGSKYPYYYSNGYGNNNYYGYYRPGGVTYPVSVPFKNKFNAYPSFSHIGKPFYNPRIWYNKGYYGGSSYYAPGCTYPSVKPTVTSTPSYSYSSAGTPLSYNYATSSSYGVPSTSFSTKSNLGFGLKSYATPNYFFDAGQTSGSSSYIPSVPQPPGGISYPALPSTPQPPSGISYPNLPSTSLPSPPQPPSSSYFQYPNVPSLGTTGAPTVPAAVSNFPYSTSQLPSTPSPPSFGSQSIPYSPVLRQDYNVLIPIPSSSVQSVENENHEVVITPPPITKVKSDFITALPGSNIGVTSDQNSYGPPYGYAVSYYPNVFYISNQQNNERPSGAGASESSVDSQSAQPIPTDESTGGSTDSTSSGETSTETSSRRSSRPVITSFYSSNTIDQTRIPLFYTADQYTVPAGGLYYSTPVISGAPSSFSYSYGPSQGVPAIPQTKSSNANAYAYSSFGAPQNAQPLSATTASPPC